MRAAFTASTALRERLAAASRFDAEYHDGLSNHLPMALVALERLGAGEERLADFEARYARRLNGAPPPEPWPAGDAWRDRLGDPRAWPAYRSLFAQWIEIEGADVVLPQTLPALMQGVGAAAFHGPIRVAYALAANHAAELADGLAYWACRWFACGDRLVAGAGAEGDPQPVLDALHVVPPPQERLIANAMAVAAAHPDFLPLVARAGIDNARATLSRLAHIAAERYVAQGGFTALHLVTSAQAMTVLLPWLDDAAAQRDAVAWYLQAFAAGWAALPALDHAEAAPAALPWPEMAARAIESDNEHVVKLVDACQELERSEGGAVWAQAAMRVLALGV